MLVVISGYSGKISLCPFQHIQGPDAFLPSHQLVQTGNRKLLHLMVIDMYGKTNERPISELPLKIKDEKEEILG